jgi:hypothetical protein
MMAQTNGRSSKMSAAARNVDAGTASSRTLSNVVHFQIAWLSCLGHTSSVAYRMSCKDIIVKICRGVIRVDCTVAVS